LRELLIAAAHLLRYGSQGRDVLRTCVLQIRHLMSRFGLQSLKSLGGLIYFSDQFLHPAYMLADLGDPLGPSAREISVEG